MPLFRLLGIKGAYLLLFLSQRRPIGMAIIAQRLRLVPRITHHLQGGETRAAAFESSIGGEKRVLLDKLDLLGHARPSCSITGSRRPTVQ